MLIRAQGLERVLLDSANESVPMMPRQDTLVEKLRLKNAALHVQKRKLYLQMRQKEEMGEALHEVDFQQLKIENSQYLERIDEKNQDLLRLKLMAGNTLQILNSYKVWIAIVLKQSMFTQSNLPVWYSKCVV